MGAVVEMICLLHWIYRNGSRLGLLHGNQPSLLHRDRAFANRRLTRETAHRVTKPGYHEHPRNQWNEWDLPCRVARLIYYYAAAVLPQWAATGRRNSS